MGSGSRLLPLQHRRSSLKSALGGVEELFNSLPIGIYRATLNGQTLMANKVVFRLLGHADDIDPNKLQIEFAHHRLNYSQEEFHELLRREGEIRGLESEWETADGRTIHVRENARLERDEEGKILYYEGTLEDITDRRMAEKALRASEERYRSVVEHSPAGVLLIDHEARIIYANDEAQRILGRTFGELVGQRFIRFVHTDSRSLVLRRYAQRQQGEVVPPRYEIKIVRKNGDVRELELSATVYQNSTGDMRSVAQILDITERKKASAALRQYTSELEIRNAELDAFADSVAHDLRNPLGTMIGFAEILRQDYDELSDEEVRTVLERISRLGHKMNTIIDELLLFARVRKAAVEPVPVDMGPIVEEVVCTRLQSMIQASDARVIVPNQWPTALGHAPWIEEVWANYISNAIRYGGVPPLVELGADRLADGSIRFWVRDNGQGVTPEAQDHLFQAFSQVDQWQSRSPGHGLGLSIVRRIVERLGGSVSVFSNGVPGEGSTFRFRLPAPANSDYSVQEVGKGSISTDEREVELSCPE